MSSPDVTPARRPRRRVATALVDTFAGGSAYGAIREAGDMGALGVRAVRLALTPPFPWIRDAVSEGSRAIRRCLIPLSLSVSAFMIGFAIIVFGNLLGSLGATDREAGGMWVAFSREVCVWITTMIFAGVAGSAITADLGARKIREELDALAVLGVDRFRSLVVPRVVAMTLGAPILGMLALLVSQAVNFAVAPGHLGLTDEVFADNLVLNVLPLDLYASIVKYLLIGFFVGVVSCQKGLSCDGGAEGVGRAVNQTVVVCFLGIWIINSLFNLGYLTIFPETAILRG
ncbi:MlaE family ABC transporter permease [Patulibacter defluvii]|uniref:MlaE family ABC transporter permease n=1 Tax=Patulibacter defluvii TaxID=3095358 RepID=UPI002A75037A|nr:ABC transporter permease [Patulibacter sp. DM4]